MAHSTMHFAVGLAVGTALLIPAVLKKIRDCEKTSAATGKLLAVSYTLAFTAIIPNLLRHSGIPDTFCSGWWMNLFFFNPLLDKLKSGGMLIGEVLILLFFCIHYAIIIAGITRTNTHTAAFKNNV